jgi:conjugative relaxase-like TrwC/TraI family protein
MLNTSRPLTSIKMADYHKASYANAEENYWSKSAVVPAQWHGKLADHFGLTAAPVTEEAFRRLAEGQNPHTGEQLVRHRAVHEYTDERGRVVRSMSHRAGWDGTISAPKSVSLAALVGGDERIREWHREAVSTALREWEKYAAARIGGNAPADRTGRFLVATFEHDVSRPVDGYVAPQLHTHAVTFNIAQRGDGRIGAMQEKGLFEQQAFITAVYQSELMYRLKRGGYEIEPGKSGAPEIKGFTREYLEANSLRAEQIRQHLTENALTGPEAAQLAAHHTRAEKSHKTAEQVRQEQLELAAAHGNQPHHVVQAALSRGYQHQTANTLGLAHQAVAWSREHNYQTEHVVEQTAILMHALRRGMGEVRLPEVRTAFAQQLKKGQFVQVAHHKHASTEAYTTPEAIEATKRVIAAMLNGQGQMSPIMATAQARREAAQNPILNARQRHAVAEVLSSTDRIHAIQGYAGVGKTTVLTSIRHAAEHRGYVVQGIAPTTGAAHQLEDASISSMTLQAFLRMKEQPRAPSEQRLIFLDESSLASTKQVDELFAKLPAQDRVVLVGDIRQHQAVDAGAPFEQLQQAGMHTAVLDGIVRQKNPELLKAVEHLSQDRIHEGIEVLRNSGGVNEIFDRKTRFDTIAKQFAEAPEQTLVTAPDNASRRGINESVRSELQRIGLVSKTDESIPVLVQRSDMSVAERRWAARYDRGDIIEYQRGSKALGVHMGERTTVIDIDVRNNRLVVERKDRSVLSYDPRRLSGVTVYRPETREFAIGDRIQLTRASHANALPNRFIGKVTAIDTASGIIQMAAPSGRTVTIDSKLHPFLDHGYAMTSHASEGQTVDRVLIHVDKDVARDLVNTRFAYVSVSRGRHEAVIFTDNAETLADRMSHQVSKSHAVDMQQGIAP